MSPNKTALTADQVSVTAHGSATGLACARTILAADNGLDSHSGVAVPAFSPIFIN
jgi:hypothetical protein